MIRFSASRWGLGEARRLKWGKQAFRVAEARARERERGLV